MKNVKLALCFAALAALAFVMIQNWTFFASDQSLHFNLYYSQYQLPKWPVAVLFLSAFIFGCIVSGLYVLPGRIQRGRRIKRLNAELAACKKKVAIMQDSAASENHPEKSKAIAFWRNKGKKQHQELRPANPTISIGSGGYSEVSAPSTEKLN